MIKQLLHGKRHDIIITLVVTLLLSNGYLFAQEQYNIEKDYFILPLKNVSVQTGMQFLSDAKVDCTYTNVPGSSTIVVRSKQQQEQNKARVILNLVDAQVQYAIKIIQSTSKTDLPANKEIIAKAGNLSIGSFSNPPSGSSPKVIIDTHDDSVVVIAPKPLIEKIVSTITQISNEEKEQFTQLTEPVKPELISTTVEQEQELDIVPSLFAQNLDKKTPEKNFSEERITAPVEKKPIPAKKIVTEQPKKLETVPGLFAANQDSEPLPTINPDDEIILNLEGKLTLIELLGFVGPYLQMDFAYNESDLANKDMTFSPNGTLKGPIKIRDAYDILETIFRLKGLIMTRGKGNIVTILPITDVLDSDPELLKSEDSEAELGDSVVISLFKIKHIDLASAQNLLNGMKLTTSITPLEQTKTLIVTGYSSRMPRIKALLEIVDKPGEPKEIRFRKLKYTSAKTLSPKVKTLAEQLGTISITVTGTSLPDVPQRSEPKRPTESNAEYQRRITADRQARDALARAQASIQQPSTSGPTVYLDADERTNRIMMIGLREQLDDVEELINTLDVAQQDLRTLQLYKIENLDAEDIREKLQELNIIGETSPSSSSPRITGDEKPAAAQAAVIRNNTSDAESSALAEEPKVVVIEQTNTLLVYATAEQHMQIASIINFVDREIEDEEMPYKMYQLKNTSPEHVFSVIEPLIQETVQDAEGKIERVEFKQDDRITIVADPNTSSLIVNANKKNQEWIGDLIEKLDRRRPQVLIDVTLVQISKTDQFDYDLNLLSSFPDLTSTSGVTNALLPGAQGTNLVKSLLDSPRGHFVDFQSTGGTGTGFYADKHINALLTAMQQKDYGRVLATPKILVNDNQEGEIISTDVTYVTRTSSIPVRTGTAGDEANLIQTETNYDDYDAGITLRITPHISESELLRLDIDLERSDFGTITGDKPPDTQVSNIRTNVTVPDGSTIILGGLQKLNQSKGGTKVPLLGDIPLIGGAFRSISNSDIQRNLYVFVKAEVIRPPDDGVAQADLERISNINRKEFEKQEREFQKYESWPGIISEPMKPWKVLDTQ